jgi:hypothetical protein
MKILLTIFLLNIVSVLAEQPTAEKVLFEYRALPASITDHSFRKQSVTLRLRDGLIIGQVYSQGELVLDFGGDVAFTQRITRLLRDIVLPELDWKAHLIGVAEKNSRMVDIPLHARSYTVYVDAGGSACSFQMVEPAFYIQKLASDDELVRRLDRVFEAIDAEFGPMQLHFFRSRPVHDR